MEVTQLTTMVKWLEKELKANQDTIAGLQRQLADREAEMSDHVSRIMELEGQLSQVQAHMARIDSYEDSNQRFRDEVKGTLEEYGSRVKQSMRDVDRLRKSELDGQAQLIGEIRKEIDRFRQYEEVIDGIRSSMGGLNASMSEFQVQFKDADRKREDTMSTVKFLEEQRHKDARRAADLQSEFAETVKKMEMYFSKVQFLEESVPRASEVKNAMEDIRRTLRETLEKADYQEAQRARQLRLWSDQMESNRQRIEEYAHRMEEMFSQYPRLQHALNSLLEFEERLERQQHELAELQRLADERQKGRFEEMMADYEKEWGKFEGTINFWREEQERMAGRQETRLRDLEKEARSLREHVLRILEMIEEDAQGRVMFSQEWQARFEEIAMMLASDEDRRKEQK